MSKSTISTFELFRMFPDQESARVYFEARRWLAGDHPPMQNERDGVDHCATSRAPAR